MSSIVDTRFAPPTLVPTSANHPEYRNVRMDELDLYAGWHLVLVYQEPTAPCERWDNRANAAVHFPQIQHRAILMRDIENATVKLQKALEDAAARAKAAEAAVERGLKQEAADADRLKRIETDMVALNARLGEEKQKSRELHEMAHKLERGMNEERKKLDKLKAVLGSERFEQILNEKPTSPG
jgi:hypothetical protein